MATRQQIISPEIFSLFPGYQRGVVVACDVNNGPSSDALIRLLRQAEDSVRERLNLDQITENEQIKSWREAFRSFGAKPSEFRPSIEAMARRALRGDTLPSINALVDIGNIISLRYLLPSGGHSIDALQQDMRLCRANGTEDFVPFGSDQHEAPLPGEVIFAEGNTVLTRRWTWRQANHTLTLSHTRSIEFNIDGLPPVDTSLVEQACQDLEQLVLQFCGGRIRHEILSEDHPAIPLEA